MSSPGIESGPIQEPDPLVSALERAERWFDAQRYERAERDLTAALAIDPESLDAHILLARCAIARGDMARAEEWVRAAVAIAPDSPGSLGLLAIVSVERGRFGEAEQNVLQALRLAPDTAWLYEVYGDIMRLTAHSEKARRLYERGLSLAPDDAALHSKLALIAAGESRAEAARLHAERGLAEDADSAFSHAAHAAALLSAGRPFAARRGFREALRNDPSNPHLEEAWRESDKCCRLVYLPMYYWTLAMRRIPGGPFTIWGAYLALVFAAPKLGVPPAVRNVIAVSYLILVVYTWVADWIVRGWIRIRPAT